MIRPYQPCDAAACYGVFYQAVHQTAARDYPKRHLHAWAPSPDMPTDWPDTLGQQMTLTAHAPNLCGFITLADHGYLDFLYTAPSHARQGIATMLYQAALQDNTAPHLTTEASHLSRPFFLKHGWHEVAAQKVERHGQWITNFQMELHR
ncbi:GNAT family N-acetyltransferase [Nereida sp. MMG025]|uniref:GNAT family N-acetyltransferase n=1 Tax=Nereida sp. MMG025 TaxID=2909981 RepID=UPI001F0257E7|nr:GNAT family N-acetyltransferase [Nereida sp. MMG025]MCF6445259.1 GNAT family N-acetyltransferase [Nereida sp. MMG025]